ncbi:hypothetical protein PG994_013581 [Apiospora phragmitis]|uniref:Uncharacterized protein n=1 Tax=Apiospora phragmitis TaxID=2905665 RepID=A0ABR1TBM5_9PEZI
MHVQQILFLLAAAITTLTEALNGDSFECNTARVRIVTGLQETRTNTNNIADAETKQTANAGINQAANAINSIAVAVFSGETTPADARDITEAGLEITQAALQGVIRVSVC